ncbi:MAG: DEAD/DEAH box helicase [Chloracidobacterium sp.]|nr:DEAD/DEAH box helicase [Chloracidobacterium sp.]
MMLLTKRSLDALLMDKLITPKLMTLNYFSEMLPVLSQRAKYAANSYLRFANEPLTQHLGQMFDQPFGQPGAFLADPTFEAVYGWETGEQTMADLAGKLLTKDIVHAMDNPPKEHIEDYRFGKDQKPYKHQIKAWEALSQPTPQSIIVASGTGSGKTECFMVPILDQLAKQRAENQGKLIGVRALFLYPLNALINSQRERLRAWTSAFDGDVRFSLYNGNTPDVVPTQTAKGHPSEALDRKSLRQAPPPILVTNATMLEYMLVRTADAPIIEASQGKLEWVVLDEAHSYIGSQAAEMAFLIRRVLLAFGVRPENVRFVATSATIGDPEGAAGEQLRTFLAGISGVDPARIHVIAGNRAIPSLTFLDTNDNKTLGDLRAIEPEKECSAERYAAICESSTAQRLRRLFIGDTSSPPVSRLSEICRTVFPDRPNIGNDHYEECLKWLDLLSGTKPASKNGNDNGDSFLPLRAHLFHRTFSGLWACADPDCDQKQGTPLNSKKWPFGLIYFDIRNHCSCGSPVYEVVRCDGCGEPFLLAGIDSDGTVCHLLPETVLDEFELDDETDNEESEFDDSHENQKTVNSQNKLLIANQNLTNVDLVYVDRATRKETERTEGVLHLRAHEDAGGGLTCPSCGTKEGSRRKVFLSSRIGAPYFLGSILPSLLEYAPDGEKPADNPCRGRRLLSFNDSRQGTARIAARLQQESERNRVRGLLYHFVLAGRTSNGSTKAQEIEKLIGDLEKANNVSPSDQLRSIIDQKRQELLLLTESKTVGFADLANSLANSGTDFDQMLGLYRRIAGDIFQDRGSVELARMFLVREFGRRPKRNNNLETMGLVSIRYPALDVVQQVPHSIQAVTALTIFDWRDLLKICLDFFVRANGALEINRDWRKWLGVPFPQSFLIDRDSSEVGRNQKRWLRAKRMGMRSSLGRLLAFTLQKNIDLPEGEDIIDAVLLELWNTLCSVGLLVQRPEGRVLPLDHLAFAPIELGWICPVTRRVLDTTLKGVTPYLPSEPTKNTTNCENISLPIYDKPFSDTTDELARIRNGRKWLSENQEVLILRDKGIWTSFHDRAVELSLYFTTAEHSAQQDSSTLELYEKWFKNGALNLLSCSTTMEMGIDIGGISMVAMNNVPPHPANYLQRAGRAGRRREARSTSMTLCKTNPHDQAVFKNSRWAFDGDLPAPRVSLDSPRIVQRHVNSYLLSHFLRERLGNAGQESLRLNCGGYFLGENPLADQFPAWAMIAPVANDSEIGAGLKELVRGSIFDGRSLTSVATDASLAMSDVTSKWKSEWDQLERELQDVKGQPGYEEVAVKAIQMHMSRMTDEYLLRELSARGFLPAHGFPTNIASFDNLTISQFKRIKGNKVSGREDNRYRRREMASRDIATALREYAPGSEIVMDGLVYKSAGVTLNWHIPADQSDVKEIQEIRFASRCRKCGASGSSYSLEASSTCKECGNEIGSKDRIEFLEPAGFAVDFYDDPTNDTSTQKYIPVEDPWIDAEGPWLTLPNPDLGRYRVSTQGHIFHQSRGIYGFGYAICLECGRAEPMTDRATLPLAFQRPHNKLRRSKNEGRSCPGSNNPWKIKKGLSLGHEGWTDILELQLKTETGAWLDDPVAASTICVAVRDAIAEIIGIQSNELGCQIKQSRLEFGGNCRSLLIFDRYAAGYVSGADRFIASVFHAAHKRLQCSANCDSVCPNCLLDYDQRFAIDNLDRHRGLEILTDTWLDSLKLPDDYEFFGPETRLEPHNISESIWRTVSQSRINGVRFYTSGPKADWDIAPSSLRETAYRLAGRGINIEIVIPGQLTGLNDEDRNVLASLSDHPDISIRTISEPARVQNGWLLAETIKGPSTRWAIDSEDGLAFNSNWGSTEGLTVKTNLGRSEEIVGDPLLSNNIRPENIDLGDREIEILSDLDGPVSFFGNLFWQRVCNEHDPTRLLLESAEDKVIHFKYSDRYLFTPISVAILFEIVNGLRNKIGTARWADAKSTIHTARKSVSGDAWYPNKLGSDWQDDNTRENVIRTLFQNIGTESSIELLQTAELGHGRIMEIEFSTGRKLIVRMDQGVGYWRIAPTANRQLVLFNFNGPVTDQCSTLARLTVRVEGREMPTQLFLKLR